MKEETIKQIVSHYITMEELKEIHSNVTKSMAGKVDFYIRSTHLLSYLDPFIAKCKDKLNVSSETLTTVLDMLIKLEKEKIDDIIDAEIDRRIKEE